MSGGMNLQNRIGASGPILALLLCFCAGLAATPANALDIPATWPDADGARGAEVRFPTASPFSLAEVAAGVAPADEAIGYFFLPAEASPAHPVPAVVMLHGAGGIQGARELAYGAQLAEMGIAALVVDVFGARRDIATGFVNRLINITESAMVTDAYAALDWLDARPEVDARNTVLIGFSYGAMATVFAAYEQVAGLFADGDAPRFAGHVAFYGPCIARFRENRTTGAPVLFLSGARDAIVDQERCGEIRDDLRRGGSPVTDIVYPEGMHQWDGHFGSPRMIGRNLAPCRLQVGPDFSVIDLNSTLPMASTFFRKVILGLCAGSEGYMIGRDDAVRAQSNAELGRFLERVFNGRQGAS